MVRRLYRIYAHAVINHPVLFNGFERETLSFHRFTDFILSERLMVKEELDIDINTGKLAVKKFSKKKK
jgi:hypothetical protein